MQMAFLRHLLGHYLRANKKHNWGTSGGLWPHEAKPEAVGSVTALPGPWGMLLLEDIYQFASLRPGCILKWGRGHYQIANCPLGCSGSPRWGSSSGPLVSCLCCWFGKCWWAERWTFTWAMAWGWLTTLWCCHPSVPAWFFFPEASRDMDKVSSSVFYVPNCTGSIGQ